MVYIKSFVATLIALSVFLGVIKFLFPKGTLSAPLKLMCGLIALVTLLSPIDKFITLTTDYNVEAAAAQAANQYNSESLNEIYKEQVLNAAKNGISEDIEAYLLEEYGVSPYSVEVSLSLAEDGEVNVDFIGIVFSSAEDKNKVNTYDLKSRYGTVEISVKTIESG